MEHILNQLTLYDNTVVVVEYLLEQLLHHDITNWDDADYFVFQFPELTNTTLDDNGLYFLHYACWKRANIDTIHELLQHYPEAFSKTTKQGKYPLHYACEFHQPYSIIDSFITKFPQAIQDKDDDGCYPLHYAYKSYQSLSTVKLLVKKFPQAIKEKDNDGQYQLALARCYGQTEEVIQFLQNEMCSATSPRDETNVDDSINLEINSPTNNNDDIPRLVWKDPFTEVIRTLDGELPLREVSEQTKQILLTQLSVEYPDWNNIVRFLIDSQEDLTKISLDDNGLYLLHYALWKQAPVRMTEYFMYKYPEAIGKKTANGMYPLHYACDRLQPEKVIYALIFKYSQAVEAEDDKGLYPLHYACQKCQSPQVIKLLRDKFPKAMVAKFNNGSYPLHYACRNYQTEEFIKLLMDNWSYNEEITITNKQIQLLTKSDGEIPLHLAISYFQSVNVIEYIIRQCPESVKYQKCGKLLPLDIALDTAASAAVVELLIMAYPEYLKEHPELLHLHKACQNNIFESVIPFMIQTFPGAVKIMNEESEYPLLLACGSNFSDSVILMLLNGYPDALKQKNSTGSLPLHAACSNTSSVSVIPVMIQIYPQALCSMNVTSRYPLHVACHNELSDQMILMLYHWSAQHQGKNGKSIIHHRDESGLIPSNYVKQIRYKIYKWLLRNMDVQTVVIKQS